MLQTLLFPIVDARYFIGHDTGYFHLVKPPLERSDFLRSFGALKRRVDKYDEDQEKIYSQANKAIRFCPPGPNILGSKPLTINPGNVERKCYVNDYGCRIEITYADNNLRTTDLLVEEELVGLITDFLTTQVKIPLVGNGPNNTDLIKAGTNLAKLYLNATTKHNKADGIIPQWVNNSDPMVLMVYNNNKKLDTVRLIKIKTEVDNDPDWFGLYYTNLIIKDKRVACWIINVKGLQYFNRSTQIRRLRTYLLRSHVEREIIKRVFWLIKSNYLKLEKGEETSEKTQNFLNWAIKQMTKTERFGFDNAHISATANHFDALVNQDERDELLSMLQKYDIRPTILRKVENLTDIKNNGHIGYGGGIGNIRSL